MEFQRYIKLINGTSSNDSFTKKLQNYCSEKYLKVKSRISHKQNRQNQMELKLNQKQITELQQETIFLERFVKYSNDKKLTTMYMVRMMTEAAS